jgi:TolA-binding protein
MNRIRLFVITFIVFFLTADNLSAATSASSSCWIQIAGYRQEQKAIDYSKSMKDLGFETSYKQITADSLGKWYQVFLGRFKDSHDARQAAEQLKREGIIADYVIRTFADEMPKKSATTTASKKQGEIWGENKAGKTEIGMKSTKERDIQIKKDSANMSDREDETPRIEEDQKRQKITPPAEPMPNPAATETTAKKFIPAKTPADFPVLNRAFALFQKGNYEEAGRELKHVIDRKGIELGAKEPALRLIAECHYFLGQKGSKREYLIAIELFKEYIAKYPGDGDEHAEIQYKLAKSYENLDFHYEAKREYEILYAKYPQSAFVPESIFMAGEIGYRIKRFDDAAVKLKEYVSKYPDGGYVKKALFKIAGCYSQLQQTQEADHWYKEALKRWPDYDSIPRLDILNLAFHYFRNHQYENAVEMYFLYANLYPQDENIKNVLYDAARSLMEMRQYAIALKVFNLVIERYPHSRQAWESVVIMANLGVRQPGIKLPIFMVGADYYNEPIRTYNFMLKKFPFGDLTEGLFFQRGIALWMAGRYKEAFNNNIFLINQFPRGRYKTETMANLTQNIEYLVGDAYGRGDYIYVSDIYFRAKDKEIHKYRDIKVGLQVGESLKRLGFYGEALKVFSDLLREASGPDKGQIRLQLAECHTRRGDYESAESILKEVVVSTNQNSTITEGGKRLLGDIYYKKRNFDKAIFNYESTLKSQQPFDDNAVLNRNYAAALMASRSYASAKLQFQNAISNYEKNPRKYTQDVPIDAYMGLGDCLFRERNYKEAVLMYKRASTAIAEGTVSLWPLYGMAKGYVRIESLPQAEQVLSSIREEGGEGFWSELADYALREENWTAKYGKYLGQL